MRRLAALLACAAAACVPESEPAPAEPPNLLLFAVDTLRADSLGAYGNPVVETPVVDRLAREGALFERAYAPSSWTRPSVATLLSGLGPEVHGVADRLDELSARVTLVSEVLAERGYATGAVVANPNVGSFYGFAQGFDHFAELYEPRKGGRVGLLDAVASADEVVDRAIAWLDVAPRPFFLFVLAVDPHWPYEPPPEFDRYGGDYDGPVSDGRKGATGTGFDAADRARIRAFYDGAVAYTDAAFGRLLAHLGAQGLAESTVVAFASDHGEEFWDHGGRWHGRNLHEESLRVPLVWRGPGVPAGRRIASPVGLADVAATLLALARVPSEALPGRPLFDPAEEEPAPLHATLDLEGRRSQAWIDGRWKLIRDPDAGRSALYDLAADPAETRDLAAERASERKAFEARLAARLAAERTRRHALLDGAEAPRVEESQLPEEQRRALEALGYLETGAP